MDDETIIFQDDTVSVPADDLQPDLGLSEITPEQLEQAVATPNPFDTLTEVTIAAESMDELKTLFSDTLSDLAHVNLFSSFLVSGALIGVLLLRLSR